MRILMISHEFSRSGASRMFVKLARHLRTAGHVLTVFPIAPADGPARHDLLACGIEIAGRIVDRGFDLAIANTVCAAPVVLSIGATVPTIWWIHEAEIGLVMLLRQPQWVDAFALSAAVVLQAAFQRDRIFCPFLAPVDPRRVFVIPNGVDAPTDDARAVVPPPPEAGTIRVICVGTVEPRKRQADLLHAVAQLEGVQCLIVGRHVGLPPEAQEMAQTAPARFRLLGEVEDHVMMAWLRAADVFCLPSMSETHALAAHEAAHLAKPLVLSDLQAYHGVFAHGRDALLVPVGDVDLLAAMLEALVTRPALRRRLGEAARNTAAYFTEKRFTTAFDAVIVDVAPQARPAG
jgi:glycosyltransferase involved in cell wall biosynthesis